MSRRLENLIRRYKEICPQEPCFNLTEREQDLYSRLESGEDIGDKEMEYLIEQSVSEQLKEKKYRECVDLREMAQEYFDDITTIKDEKKRMEVYGHLYAIDVAEDRADECQSFNRKRKIGTSSRKESAKSSESLKKPIDYKELEEQFGEIRLVTPSTEKESSGGSSMEKPSEWYMGIPGLTREGYNTIRQASVRQEIHVRDFVNKIITGEVVPFYKGFCEFLNGLKKSSKKKMLIKDNDIKFIEEDMGIYDALINDVILKKYNAHIQEEIKYYEKKGDHFKVEILKMMLRNASRIRNATLKFINSEHIIGNESEKLNYLIKKIEFEKSEHLRKANTLGDFYYAKILDFHASLNPIIYFLQYNRKEVDNLKKCTL